LAKTLLVRTLAQVLDWSFRRIQFTPDMMPADIIGIELLQEDPTAGGRRMQFVPGPVFAHIILADEINRTPPKTQAALLEAMQEYTVTSMGKPHRLDEPFIVFATQNPIEHEGTYPLPEAQLDRFMFSLWMGYPSAEEEEEIALATTTREHPEVQRVLSMERIVSFQKLVRRMPVSRHVVRYAVSIARATRPDSAEASEFIRQYVTWGAGPRASQYLLLGAKALAVLDGEPTVSGQHVREVAPLVLRHRILPNYHATGEGITAAEIVKKILGQTAEPTYA
jgi:MoxR-like ATPase